MSTRAWRGAFMTLTLLAASAMPVKAQTTLQDYRRPDALEPLPAGMASLYATPWRANPRTASAHDALDGIGVYYKHMPAWSPEQHAAVMGQMKAAGVRRLRMAIEYPMYLHVDWTGPTADELAVTRNRLVGAKQAGVRPVATFVHLPPVGKPGELQTWWKATWNNGHMPADEIGTPVYEKFVEVSYAALKVLLDE